MAVSNGTIAEFSPWGATTPVSIEFTPVDAARAIVVATVNNGAVDDQFTGITVEGVAMTRVDFAIDSAGETGRGELWFLAGAFPSGVAQTVQITTTGGLGTKWASVASVKSLSIPEVAISSKLEGDQTNPQIALNTAPTSSLRMAVLFSGHDAAGTPVEVTGMEAVVAASQHDFGTTVAKLGRQAAWAKTYTIGWTAASEDTAMVAIAIQESDGGVLPAVSAGQSGHVDHHNLIHDDLNGIDGYPATSDGPLAEFYNAMMSHFNGDRATPLFVNVQHPDFGADGRNASGTDEQPAIQEAIDFLDATYIGGRTLWLPAINSEGARTRYYVDRPIRLHSGLNWWAYGARIAASPRFDFVTAFPTDNWTDYPQAILETYNVFEGQLNGRLALSRVSLRGGLIEGLDIASSRGALVSLQQQSSWFGVRFEECDTGIIIGGQQGIFHDLMVTAAKTDPPSAANPYVGIQLGIDVVPEFPASFFWFYGTNIEGQYRAVKQIRGIGANVFRDLHIEGVVTSDAANPAYCFQLSQGQLIVDQAWWTAAGGNPLRDRGTFLHRDDTASSFHLKDIFIQLNGPPNDHAVFITDVDGGHSIQAWGETQLSVGEQGIVRHIQEIIRPRSGGVNPRRHVITILHDEGGYTALGSYDESTADAEQTPLVTLRPGATQMGHLISWTDKTGVEKFLVTADGMPKLPGYTAATKPAAAGRESVMIYDLDTNIVQVSDGATWVNIH